MEQAFDVYISYAREDLIRVRELAYFLEDNGLKVWWQSQPEDANESLRILEQHLTEGKAQIVVWSRDSCGSGRIQAEARLGSQKGRLIAVRFQNILPPNGTRALAYADLSDWQGGSGHRHIQKLFTTLNDLTGKGPRFEVTPPPIPEVPHVQAPPSAFDQLGEAEKDERAWQITKGYNNQTYYYNKISNYFIILTNIYNNHTNNYNNYNNNTNNYNTYNNNNNTRVYT